MLTLSRTRFSILLIILLLQPAQLLADDLWQLLDAAEYPEELAAVTLPPGARQVAAVALSAAMLDGLEEGESITVAPAQADAHDYRISAMDQFLSGDTGLRASLEGAGENQVLSLTRNSTDLVATLYSPSGNYRLQAKRSGSQGYIGWLYNWPESAQVLPPDRDLSAPAPEVQILALSFEEVSVNQTFTPATPLIGQELHINYAITNNTANTLTDLPVAVVFLLDDNELLSAPPGCVVEDVVFSNGTFTDLKCTVASLPGGATTNLEVTVTVLEAAYPSGVSSLQVDNLRFDDFFFPNHDMLLDSDNDGIGDENEKLTGTDPFDSNSRFPEQENVEIDVLFFYTPKFTADSGHGDAMLEINQQMQMVNDMYENSGADITFRAVHYQAVDHVVDNVSDSLALLRERQGPFSDTDFLRASYGADVIFLLDGIVNKNQACGRAALGGSFSSGDLMADWDRDANSGFSFLPGGFNPAINLVCSQSTLAHELGHMMGLDHSRFQPEGLAGTFAWALGHGINGDFRTIMAYAVHFPDSEGLPRFSNPQRSDCNGNPCGVSRDDPVAGADAVGALNVTRFAVSQFVGTRPTLVAANASGESTAATMLGGAIRSLVPSQPVEYNTQFGSQEAINVVGTIQVDPAHVGQSGRTHVVIDGGALGFFQMDNTGNYVPWDGDVATLSGTSATRPLLAREDLVAVKGLRFADLGITNIAISIYLAYSVDGTSNLVFSATPIPVTIVP